MKDYIEIKGARVNNLKNVNVKIPRNKLVVVAGVSGSGKSSLAFDTLYAEGQRRYVESLSSYARQFLVRMKYLLQPSFMIYRLSIIQSIFLKVKLRFLIMTKMEILFGTLHCVML